MDTTTIEVSDETWRQLNRRKQRGETFDDVIQDMMNAEIREGHPDYDPRIVDWEPADGDDDCANFIPDRGSCEDSADYIVSIQAGEDGKVSEVPYCEEHANLPENEVEA